MQVGWRASCLKPELGFPKRRTVIYRVIVSDGSIVMDGFATNTAAWPWVDEHSQTDQVDAAKVDRIREAFASR